MKGSRFVMHHVGGRGGGRAFPTISELEHEFISVMYEASSDGNEQIVARGTRTGTGETILVNACVGKPGENRVFNLNRDPCTSSLLKLNSKYQNFYINKPNYDYLFREAMSTLLEETVRTESLDDLIRLRNLPECDFLSLDTQGSELEILQHASKTLAGCVGLKLEVSFVPNYEDKPLYGDINNFLVDSGFHFIRFTRISEWAPRELSEDFRGEKMQFETDAIYFKEPSLLTSSQIYPAIFTALAFGQTEFAMYIYRICEKQLIPPFDSKWVRFCASFLDQASTSLSSRRTFSDTFSVEQSFARFAEPDLKVTDSLSLMRKIYRAMPSGVRTILLRLYLFPRKRKKLKMKRKASTKVEKMYEAIGNSKVSESFKQRRSV